MNTSLFTRNYHFELFTLGTNNVTTMVDNGQVYFGFYELAKAFEIEERQAHRYWNELKGLAEMCNSSAEDDGVTNCHPTERLYPSVKKMEVLDKFGRMQVMNFVNEAGMYFLMFKSKNIMCLRFTHWVISEVLPSLRQKGYYVNDTITPEQLQFLENELTEKKLLLSSAAENDEYFSVNNFYLQKYGKTLGSVGICISLGRTAGKLSKEMGFEVIDQPMGNDRTPRHTYHKEVLEIVFHDYLDKLERKEHKLRKALEKVQKFFK